MSLLHSLAEKYLQIGDLGVSFQIDMADVIKATSDDVVSFVTNNRVKARKGFICVDGRYDSAKYAGMLARPGGNFRGIMVLLALRKKLDLPVGRILDKVVDAVEQMGIPFAIHTDDHHHSRDLADIGCGHIALAENKEHAKEYGVDPVDVHNALVYLRIKLEGRKYFQVQDLEGSHKERGVLVVTGKKYSVNHWDTKAQEMYFVYDKARDDEYLQTLFYHFKIQFPKLSLEEFKKVSDLQLNATLHNLAKGLPIFEVNVDKKNPEVKQVGIVS